MSSMKLWLARGSYIRVLAYHGTVAAESASFERQLEYLCERFKPASLDDIASLIAGERRKVPGILLSFDDGLYSNYQIAAPLLEKHGMRGLFFITSALPALERSEQAAFCDAHDILRRGEDESCVAMSWDDARDLLRREHAIGCHTASHLRFRGGLGSEALANEVGGAKAKMEAELKNPVESFAWVGGETDTYSAEGAAAIREAGFRFAFTTKSRAITSDQDPLVLHRTVIDAGMDFRLFRVKIAGAVDIAKARDRYAINKLIGGKR
jgi:peptidoglycan/xylan/chitin deacetylase (PgdA/CDA1 family)